MNCVRSTAVVFSSLALAAVAATSWISLRATASPVAASTAVDPTEAAIKQAMGQMNDALKVLAKGVNADNKAAALDELTKFETALIAAKALVPESAEKIDEKKRAAFVADFRKTLLETLKIACDAEAAIADGKYKDAEKLINNKLSAQKSAGHGKFKPEGM
jgi:hypothetical protein